jgi:hypothetical protein
MGLLDIASGGKAGLPTGGPVGAISKLAGGGAAGAVTAAGGNPFADIASSIGNEGGLLQRLTSAVQPQQAEAPQVATAQTPEADYFGSEPVREAGHSGRTYPGEAPQPATIRPAQPQRETPNWAAEKAGIFKGESGGDYDALFGFSNRPGKRFAGTKVTNMTVDEALNFSRPSGEYAQWVKGQIGRIATPMGGFQVVGRTLEAAKKGMGLTGKERMTPQLQDEIGKWIRAKQGLSAWEGYRGPGNPADYPTPLTSDARPPSMLSGIGSPTDPLLQEPPAADPLVAGGPFMGEGAAKKKRTPLKGRQGTLFPGATAGGGSDVGGGGGGQRRSAPGVQVQDYKSKLKPELLKQLDRGNMLALLQSVGAQMRGGGTSV